MVLCAYNKICARLKHSERLLTETGLNLFCLNEARIGYWFKDTTRREVVTSLLRGTPLPGSVSVSADALPVPRKVQRLEVSETVTYPDPEDRTGQARVRKRRVQETPPAESPTFAVDPAGTLPTASAPASLPERLLAPPVKFPAGSPESFVLAHTGIHAGTPVLGQSVPLKSHSRSTEWRHRKRLEEGGTIRERKVHSCSHCKEPINSPGHVHYFGHRFCPKNTNLGQFDDWLAARKQERQRRKEAKQ